MKEPTMENENVAQGKNGEPPQSHTSGHGVDNINNAPVPSTKSKETKMELSTWPHDTFGPPFVGNPNNVRYGLNEIKVNDVAYLEKKGTNKEIRVRILNIDKVITGEVINAGELFEEVKCGDKVEFTPDNIFGITE